MVCITAQHDYAVFWCASSFLLKLPECGKWKQRQCQLLLVHLGSNFRQSQHQLASKNCSFENSLHPQKGSVNQVNSLVPKKRGLATMVWPPWFGLGASETKLANQGLQIG